MHAHHDVHDYVKRLLFATLLCPVATGAWLVIALSGFGFDATLAYLGELARGYAAMSPDDQTTFRFQVFAVWGVLAFGFLFLTFAANPPRFQYRLRKDGTHWNTDVVEQ